MQETISPFTGAGVTWGQLRTTRPSFSGLVRGELLKIKNQKTTWIMAILTLVVLLLPYIVTYLAVSPTYLLQPKVFDYFCAEIAGLTRAVTGFYLMILTVRVIGLEYQLGTIRVLLARGVGRLQLLRAKLVALALVAFILLLSCLVLHATMLTGVLAWHGSLDLLSSMRGDLLLDGLIILISTIASMFLATAATVLGRSLAFGLSATIAFFPLDNFGALLLPLGYRLTHADFWLQITAYLLGPNLNQMIVALTKQQGFNFGFGPVVPVDSTHTLLVTLVYTLIFAILAGVLTIKKDVYE